MDARNHAQLRKIEIGRDLGGQVELIKGVGVGERVIVSPSDAIFDNAVVFPVSVEIKPTVG